MPADRRPVKFMSTDLRLFDSTLLHGPTGASGDLFRLPRSPVTAAEGGEPDEPLLRTPTVHARRPAERFGRHFPTGSPVNPTGDSMARTTRLSIGAVLAACAIIGAPSIALAASITDPTPTPQCL